MASLHNNNLSKRIVQKDWIQLHPLKIQSPSDFYYIQLSNKILTLLENDKNVIEFSINLKRQFAITASAYFEDIISNIGLWKAFRQIHFDKYGKNLPFLNTTDDYCPDEINLEDVKFLIWTIVQHDELVTGENLFINIENPIVSYVSILIYELLNNEYETAPENETLYNAVHSIKLASDYFLFREFLKWLHYDSYLSQEYPKNKILDEIENIKETKNQEYFKENKFALNYTLVNSLIFTAPCSPMAILATKWLAEIATDSKVKYIARAIEYKAFENYRIISKNNKILRLKLQYGEADIFELALESLSSTAEIKNKNTISCAMTFFNGLWNVNGMASFGEEEPEEKIPTESTDIKRIKKSENNKTTFDFVLKNNKNSPIAYSRDSKDLLAFLLKLFPKSTKSELIPSNIETEKNFVVFAHPNIGLVLYSDLAKWIKDKNNPCYNKQSATDDSISLLCGGYNCQREFLEYLIQNNLIPDARINSLKGEEYGRKLLQDNLDFIVRFFQPELFATK
jgi:hypothetical protein